MMIDETSRYALPIAGTTDQEATEHSQLMDKGARHEIAVVSRGDTGAAVKSVISAGSQTGPAFLRIHREIVMSVERPLCNQDTS